MTNTKSYFYSFGVARQAWLALEPVHFAFALVPVGSALSDIMCCRLHLSFEDKCGACNRCFNAKHLNDVKPFLCIKYFWGEGYAPTACALKAIKDLLAAGAVKSYDVVCHHDGEWVGVHSAELCFYNRFSSKEIKSWVFKSFISLDSFSLLSDYANGVLNKYKFIFIASAEDPRKIFADDIDHQGVARYLRNANLYRCVELQRDGLKYFSCLQFAFDDKDNEYDDFMDAFAYGQKFTFDPRADKLLGKKRNASSASKFKVEKVAK